MPMRTGISERLITRLHLAGSDVYGMSAARPHTERDHGPEDQSFATDWFESR